MSESLKVLLACAFGGFLGALVALGVNWHFWWLGILVGFGSGFLGYQPKKVVAAIPRAWELAVNWRPDPEWWKLYLKATFALWVFGVTLALPYAAFVGLPCALPDGRRVIAIWGALIAFFCSVSAVLFCAFWAYLP